MRQWPFIQNLLVGVIGYLLENKSTLFLSIINKYGRLIQKVVYFPKEVQNRMGATHLPNWICKWTMLPSTTSNSSSCPRVLSQLGDGCCLHGLLRAPTIHQVDNTFKQLIVSECIPCMLWLFSIAQSHSPLYEMKRGGSNSSKQVWVSFTDSLIH